MSDRNQLLAQIIAAMGGGGGTTPDGTPVLEAAKEYTDVQLAEVQAILSQDIQATSTRFIGSYESLEDLENSVAARAVTVGSWGIVDPVGEPPTSYFWDTTELTWTTSAPDQKILGTRARKFAILPLAGQSNAQGFGETAYQLNKENSYNPRIHQLGRYATGATTSGFTVSEASFDYGIDHELMRPYADCNLQIIPAAPCLDNIQNIWTVQNGGTTGFAFNTAKNWLKYLPDEYDIIIVPCARGGSRVSPSGAINGTYDAANKRASQDATWWSSTSSLYLDFKNRVQHCLDLSPDTLLLPVIWAQGEFDAGLQVAHAEGFEAMFDDFFGFIRDNYVDRLIDSDINNFRWLCLSSTKWMWNLTTQTDYRDYGSYAATQNDAAAYDRTAPYDNYVRLSEKKINAYGKPYIAYVRIDVNPDGTFVQTNQERGNGATSSNRPIHFSTYGNTVEIPRILASAIMSIGGLPLIDGNKHWTRFDRGSYTTTTTTNNHISIHSSNGINSFVAANPVFQQDFATATTITDTVELSPDVIVTSQGTGMTLVADDDFGQVLQMVGGGWINYAQTESAGSYTRHIVFKADLEHALETSSVNLVSSGGGTDIGVLWLGMGSLSFYPDYTPVERGKVLRWNKCHILTESKSLNGWMCATVRYDHDLKTCDMFVNGKKVCKLGGITSSSRGSLNLGNFGSSASTALHYVGLIARTRVYDEALSDSEIGHIVYEDLYKPFD